MGSDPKVSDTKLYKLAPGGNVTISVEIGDAQVGETTLLFKGVTTHMPPGQPVPLGTTADLQDEVLHTITSVQDVNPDTNRTDVTYHLRGGAVPADYPYTLVVQENGTAQYLVDFIFV